MAVDAPRNWDVFDRFRWRPPTSRPPSWKAIDRLAEGARAHLKDRLTGIDKVLVRSDRTFRRLGRKDPCRYEWTDFRPLRLNREEDWSDWLAWLLKESATGVLAAAMFGGSERDYVRPYVVTREENLPGGYRADLRIKLRTGVGLHLEVKIWDPHIEKTLDTGKAMRSKHGSAIRDFLLMPDHDPEVSMDGSISLVTWRAVADGIRRAFYIGGESPIWEAWAYAFCGAVEQRILGLPYIPERIGHREPLHRLASFATLLEVVQRRLADGP